MIVLRCLHNVVLMIILLMITKVTGKNSNFTKYKYPLVQVQQCSLQLLITKCNFIRKYFHNRKGEFLILVLGADVLNTNLYFEDDKFTSNIFLPTLSIERSPNLINSIQFSNSCDFVFMYPPTVIDFNRVLKHMENCSDSMNKYFVRWPGSANSTYLQHEAENLQKLTIPLNSDVFIINSTQSDEFNYYQISSFKFQSFRQKTDQIDIFHKGVQKRNVKNISIVAALVLEPNIIDFSNLQYIIDALNCTANILSQSDWPTVLENGSKVGGINEVLEGVADISISPIYVTEVSFSDIYILQPFYSFKPMAYFQQPKASDIRNVYMGVFHLKDWLFLASLWIILCLSLIGWHKSSPYWNFRDDLDHETIQYYILSILAVFCQQGLLNEYRSISFKSLQLLLLLTSLIVFCVYCSIIVAIFTIKVNPIKEFSDLIKFRFNFYTMENIFAGLPPLEIIDASEAMHKMTSDKSFIYPEGWFEKYHLQPKQWSFFCSRISKVNIPNKAMKLGMFLKKGSPLSEILQIIVIKKLETGVNRRNILYHEFMTEDMCTEGTFRNIGFQSLDLGDVFSAFIILTTGIAMALIAVLLERKINTPYFYLTKDTIN